MLEENWLQDGFDNKKQKMNKLKSKKDYFVLEVCTGQLCSDLARHRVEKSWQANAKWGRSHKSDQWQYRDATHISPHKTQTLMRFVMLLLTTEDL